VKALPLNQPWATLVAIGAKRIETRGYPPRRLGLHVGQRIAIYATKGLGPEQTAAEFVERCESEHFRQALAGARIVTPADLPRGAIVCTCKIAAAEQMTLTWIDTIDERERAFGYYASGRWAWTLTGVDRLEPPPPATTRQQGAFDWPPRTVASGQGTLL
jgi:activating signal cointegrator 1